MPRRLPRPARAVTFDLWHTLVYLEPDAEERYMQRQEGLAVEKLGDGGSRRTARAAFRRERAAAIAASERGRSVPVERQFARAARSLAVPDRSAEYLRAMRRELARTAFRRAPGVLPVLRALRARGVRLGVISNTVGEPGRFLRPMLAELGLAPYFDAYRFSDEGRWSKPAAAIFRGVLRELRVRPAEAVHVGDGWSDIEGARRAGLRAAVLYTGLQRYGPSYRRWFAGAPIPTGANVHRIARFEELPGLVDRIWPTPPRRAVSD